MTKVGHAIASMSRGAIHNYGRVLTVMLILFELLLLVLRPIIGDAGMGFIQRNLWFALFIYFNFQLLETCRRDPTNLFGFFLDSMLAVFGVLIGFGYFLLRIFQVKWFLRFGFEESSSMLQCMLWGVTDVLWGALISLRIAFAGKERGEFEKKAQSD